MVADVLMWRDELVLVSHREANMAEMFKIVNRYMTNFGMKTDPSLCAQGAFINSKDDMYLFIVAFIWRPPV